MQNVIDDLIILGRAAPNRMRKDRRKSYCVAGYSFKHGFIRIYPTSYKCQTNLWNIVKVPLERKPQDTRYESWKIQGSRDEWYSLEKKIEKIREYPKKDRRQLCFNLLDDCRNNINDEFRSLGIIKPEKLTGFFKRQEDIPKSKQRELWEFLELTPPENHFIKTRDEFEFIPYIKYSCSNCKSIQGYHEQQLLSIEAFEWMRKNPDNIDQLWRNFHINDPEYDLYLFIGNQQIRRTSFMVISILRFKKKNYTLENIKPLIPLKKVEKFSL